MRKSPLSLIMLAAAVIGGGYWLLQKFDIKGLDQIQFTPREASTSNGGATSWPGAPVARTGETIRIASFNIQVFGESKESKPHVMEKLAMIVRQFDIVAIQEIRCKDDGLIPRFVDLINSAGRQYDYVIGPRLGRSNSKEQYVFIFDTQSVEVDRSQLYTVADPDDLLHREPLVAWFRVRGPNPQEAFTFTLVNIHTDPDETRQELDALAAVFTAVQNDGRGEDDVIILGDLNVDDRNLGALGRLPDMAWCISGMPTNTRGTKLYDNMVFNRRSTSEFTGRAGVIDFMRHFNMTLEEALEISDHLPIWGEFSIVEGGVPGRVANLPNQPR